MRKIEWIEFEEEDVMITYFLTKEGRCYYKCKNLEEMKRKENLIKEKIHILMENNITIISKKEFEGIKQRKEKNEFKRKISKRSYRFEIMDV